MIYLQLQYIGEMTDVNFDTLLSGALEINSVMNNQEPVPDDIIPTKTITFDATGNASNYIFPTLVVIPLIIVLVITITLHVSLWIKIILIALLILSIGCYISQLKKLNIANLFSNITDSLPKKKLKKFNLFTM